MKGPREKPPDNDDLFSPKSVFENNNVLTKVGAAAIRPYLLGGNGTQAFGMETFLAGVAMLLIAVAAKDAVILMYWKGWCLLVPIRWLFADRRGHTQFWGESRPLKILTLGHN